jgi:quercetin dioxygenase-like cupin family protein
MSATSVIFGPSDGRTLQVLADRVRVLVTGEQTANRYELFDLTGPQGSGPPPPSHRWDEAYFILEGEVDVRVGDEGTHATPGSFVLALRNNSAYAH